jgi:acyl-[acyl carrier protein]--UDP-N-acetylglucosamine O-acyltransferase
MNRKDALDKIKKDFNQFDEIKMIINFIESTNRGII